MQLSFERLQALPPLAWCARISQSGDQAHVRCGTSVASEARGFFEGAWAGSFSAFDFHRSPTVFGSGGVVEDGRLMIVPPSHTLERVQLLRTEDALLVSNSLPCLLQVADDRLDPGYGHYARDFARIIDGLPYAITKLPTANERTVTLVYFYNLEIGADLTVRYRDKPSPPRFSDFASYAKTLTATATQLVANAGDQARPTVYYPLASVSTGYDSVATAAVARGAGCTRAVTFADSRDKRNKTSPGDSGVHVAEALGLEIEEFGREDYLQGRPAPECEFWASGLTGEDVVMTAFEAHLPRSLFFTGFPGTVWDRHASPGSELRRTDLSGASMSEFRLRIDFVHTPLPFVAARQHPELHRIAQSQELAPYSVGGRYDKPIARRLAEEAGVPRHLFGQRKEAASSLVHTYREAMSPGARDGVARFVESPQVSRADVVRHARHVLIHRLGWYLVRVLRRAGLLHRVPPLARRSYGTRMDTRLGALPNLWAIDTLRTRYATADSGPGHEVSS